MSLYCEVLDRITQMIGEIEPGQQIVKGAVPSEDGLSVDFKSGGQVTDTFLNKSMAADLVISVNGKNSNQEIISNALSHIHSQITGKQTYPDTQLWQITNIVSKNLPYFVEKNTEDKWVYGSELLVKIYFRGESNG